MVSSRVSVISQLSRIQPDAHRAGFGTASIGIRTSLHDQLMQDDFFHLSLQCVHPSHPCHGIAGFQPLGHTCIPGQLWHQQLHTPICRLVSFNQVRMEPLCQDIQMISRMVWMMPSSSPTIRASPPIRPPMMMLSAKIPTVPDMP